MLRKLALAGALFGSFAVMSAPAQAWPHYYHHRHRVWVTGYAAPYYGPVYYGPVYYRPYYHHHHYWRYRYW